MHSGTLGFILPCRSPVGPTAAQSGARSSREAPFDSSLNGRSSAASQRTSASLHRPGHTPTPQHRRWQDSTSTSSRPRESHRDRSRHYDTNRCGASIMLFSAIFLSSQCHDFSDDVDILMLNIWCPSETAKGCDLCQVRVMDQASEGHPLRQTKWQGLEQPVRLSCDSVD